MKIIDKIQNRKLRVKLTKPVTSSLKRLKDLTYLLLDKGEKKRRHKTKIRSENGDITIDLQIK